jgi:hypothetical protein
MPPRYWIDVFQSEIEDGGYMTTALTAVVWDTETGRDLATFGGWSRMGFAAMQDHEVRKAAADYVRELMANAK